MIMQKTEIYQCFVREARAGNFRGTRSLAMRSLSRRAGSKQCIGRNPVGELILKIHVLVGHGIAEERVVGAVESAGVRHTSGGFENYSD